MFQALLFEAVGPFNGVAAEGTHPLPSYTHQGGSFREALSSHATEKPRSAFGSTVC